MHDRLVHLWTVSWVPLAPPVLFAAMFGRLEYLWAPLTAALVALAATPAIRGVARRVGAVARPDGVRKLHAGEVPLWGGVALYAALVLGLLVARFGPWGGAGLDDLVKILVPVAGFVCLVGSLDDYRHLHSRLKLLLQIIAVLPVIAVGCWVDRIVVFGHPIDLGWAGIPLTVFWLLGCINALNLLDGMDGLASLVGLSTAVMLGIIALSLGYPHVAAIAMVLAGALAGFLIYNLPPASIFLGDSGSMVIGLVVGVLGIQGGLKTSATLSITAPAVVMALPFFDVLLAIVRRKLTGRSFDTADRQHIHHRLLDRGLTPWQVLCLLGALCLLTGAAATAATIFRNDTLAWITTLTLLVAAIRLRLFGDYEFSLLKRAAAQRLAALGRFIVRRQSPRELTARHPEPAAATALAALKFDRAWATLIRKLRPWEIRHLSLTVYRQGLWAGQHDCWFDQPAGDDPAHAWSVTVAFRGGDAQSCELQVVTGDEYGAGLSGSTRLTRVLRTFVTRLVRSPELMAGVLAVTERRPERFRHKWRQEAA